MDELELKRKRILIDELVTWIYDHTNSKKEFEMALHECRMDDDDIEGYLEVCYPYGKGKIIRDN